MRSGLSESNAFILDAMLSCSPREPISFLETPQDSPTCFLSLPLPPAIIFTQSLSPPLDILQDKDLFSKHTADLSVFKICSSSKKRKTVMKEKITKLWPYWSCQENVNCCWLCILAASALLSVPPIFQTFFLHTMFIQMTPSLVTFLLVCLPMWVLEMITSDQTLTQVWVGWILSFKKWPTCSQWRTFEEEWDIPLTQWYWLSSATPGHQWVQGWKEKLEVRVSNRTKCWRGSKGRQLPLGLWEHWRKLH